MSTTDAQEVQRLGAIAQEKGTSVLEAPVTGGLTLAKAGGITILVGGNKEDAMNVYLRAPGYEDFR